MWWIVMIILVKKKIYIYIYIIETKMFGIMAERCTFLQQNLHYAHWFLYSGAAPSTEQAKLDKPHQAYKLIHESWFSAFDKAS